MITLQLAHSPDSDDAFMFHALANGKIDTDGIVYKHVLKDIQTLNEWAREGRMEITAMSAHAWSYVADRYDILTHGASIGMNYGPQVVAREAKPLESFKKIAIPGKLTSAYLALKLRNPDFEEVLMSFDAILDAVAEGKVEAGLLIHEGQLTYPEKGLKLIVDLGKWWYDKTRLPLPMGVNTIRKDLPEDLKKKVSAQLKASIEYSLSHREEALDYALQFGRGLSRDVADRFVGMWVNDFTVDMGEQGKEGIRRFLAAGVAQGFVPQFQQITFVE